MTDKNIFKKIQNDLKNSNAKIINSNDNLSNIKKNIDSKYTEDLSDSDDDLSSYKLRNRGVINQMGTKNKIKIVDDKKKSTKKLAEKNIKKSIEESIEETIEESSDESSVNSGEESDNESDDIKYEYTEELAEKVKLYVKNDDRIRELQTELKKLNGIKKAAELDILKHLERLGETNINITGGKLRINQYESKDSLKENIIREAIEERVKDPKIIENIFEKINEKRVAGAKIQRSLKRTYERGDKK
jgi:hypothetical protein